MRNLILALLFLAGCPRPTCPTVCTDASKAAVPVADAAARPDATTDAAPSRTTLGIVNPTTTAHRVFVAFGADSAVSAINWSGFCAGVGLNCVFNLPAKGQVALPLAGAYLNATLSVDRPVTCRTTKVELNLNNPAWYDTTDISLVDGFNVGVKVNVTSAAGQSKTLGPVTGPAGNEKNYGVFPNGCDICVARQRPPCGLVPGRTGCKAGTQYAPAVPCQHQGATMGGGGTVAIVLVGK